MRFALLSGSPLNFLSKDVSLLYYGGYILAGTALLHVGFLS